MTNKFSMIKAEEDYINLVNLVTLGSFLSLESEIRA